MIMPGAFSKAAIKVVVLLINFSYVHLILYEAPILFDAILKHGFRSTFYASLLDSLGRLLDHRSIQRQDTWLCEILPRELKTVQYLNFPYKNIKIVGFTMR